MSSITLPQPERASLRATRICAIANLMLLTVQIVTGRLTGSHAIVADAIHTLVDLASDAVLFLSLWLFSLPMFSGKARRYAWLPANVAAMLMIFAGGELLWQGLIETPGPEKTLSAEACALLVAILVIGTRAGIARHFNAVASRLEAHTHQSNMLKASAWHARADVISAGVAVVGAAGTLFGIAHLDQTATLLIGGMMIGMGLLQ